ncbi:SLAM family member 5-like isoform X2 [Cervus elaphus]|uniref:SLAM family member 5-like isoform X2 n=1 Tax=Cervus elaphus TaxID=9860 RepID=UPI001CC2F4C9|nr:SLAM family member 5-like isoform X2 [Cervus elaphus]
MEPSSEDPHLCWATRLLGLTSLLLSICSTVAQNSGPRDSEAQDSGFVPMYGIRGGSVLFHVIKEQEADPEEVSWGFGPESNYRVLLRVRRGAETPTWVSLQDKYQQRVHVPSVRSLKIESLTSEDSGQYRARASFTGGIERTEVFHLTVDEPVIHPEILVKSSSITPGWCNITLECDVPGNREDLSVTWESTGLPRELEWSGTPELAPNTWELTVNLSLIQSSATLTCVVSNHVEKKTASVDFAQVCSHACSMRWWQPSGLMI